MSMEEVDVNALYCDPIVMKIVNARRYCHVHDILKQ